MTRSPAPLQAFGGAVRVTCFPGNPPTVTSLGPMTVTPRSAATAATKSLGDAGVESSTSWHGSVNTSGERTRASTAGPSLPIPSAVLRNTANSPGSSLTQLAGRVTDTGIGKGSEVTYLPAL